MSPCQVSCFRDKTLLEQNQGQYEKMLMRSENMRKYQRIFQRHPAQLSIKEKQNENINMSCGKCL
jgi:hypothetical protein